VRDEPEAAARCGAVRMTSGCCPALVEAALVPCIGSQAGKSQAQLGEGFGARLLALTA
jgi:hypothetical protein